MIPHELRFHGIRDYEPTIIDLSGEGEHILIAGPNGSGKSTITFCMGAVLYSSKVDVGGLKSRNISENETWQAGIHFLFKNEGKTRIDAPLYIEFSMAIEQKPGDPIKRVFTIFEGDDVDSLTERTVYRSGGQPNLGDYRFDLTDKYRIYPDDYYLIWYQQEVNQFAIMTPEERFRVFSEMHGIANIQRNWEKSLAQVKETESSVQEAEASIRNDQLLMMDAKNRYDRLKRHLASIRDNGQIMIQSLLAINEITKKDLEMTERIIETLGIDLDNTRETLENVQQQRVHLTTKYTEAENLHEKYGEECDDLATRLEIKQKQLEELTENERTLSMQLKEIEEKGKWLRYSEEETKDHYRKYEQTLETSEEQREKYNQMLVKLNNEKQTIYDKRAQLRAATQTFEKQAKEYADLLDQYKSKHKVQTRIKTLEQTISDQHQLISQLTQNYDDLNQEQQALENNQIVSKRQQDVIEQMNRVGKRVYPLQTLVELQEDAPIESEKRLDAIKYTMFYHAKEITPLNDLYHVSLMDIVPEYFIDSIPELHLRMKKGLTNEEKTFATKVLWWIQQFISEEKPYIRGSNVIDARGIRGQQETQTYILSEKAIKQRKRSIKQELSTIDKELLIEKEQQQKNNDELHQLHSIVNRVAEAEAFELQKHQYKRSIDLLHTYEKRLEAIAQEEKNIDKKVDSLRDQIADHNSILRALQADLDVYKQLGELKGQFETLKRIREQIKVTDGKIEKIAIHLDSKEKLFYETENQVENLKHKIRQADRKVEYAQQEIARIREQSERKSEEKDLLQGEFIGNEKKLLDLKQIIPEIYDETIQLDPLVGQSKIALQDQLTNAEREFDLTRKEEGINYEAGNIYEKARENYEKKSAELDELKILLDENIKRAEENEENLVTTIQMKVMRIQQSFQNYMTQFQFECKIEFDKYEEKYGRVVFRLLINVKKQGHRGRMEDVGLKARAGKVGKGVSGGEESLSSLLFALSLLQELDINPSFIVLDEFDSALDEGRKAKVFDLYADKLERKLIVISPKGHENNYLNHFSKAYIARHDPQLLKSILAGVRNKVKSS